jgi:hypothetical protein
LIDWLKLERAVEWEWMWGKSKVKRISRKTSPVQIMEDQKQLVNVQCLNSLGSIYTWRNI